MKKNAYYTYFGSNGAIQSTVLLDLPHITNYTITADEGKLLTNDDKTFVKTAYTTEGELINWKEVEDNGQI